MRISRSEANKTSNVQLDGYNSGEVKTLNIWVVL
jgi:hypothetical protein